jgi:hypothetical protein
MAHGDKYRWVCVRLLGENPSGICDVSGEDFERMLTWIESGSFPTNYMDWVPEQLELFARFDDMPF